MLEHQGKAPLTMPVTTLLVVGGGKIRLREILSISKVAWVSLKDGKETLTVFCILLPPKNTQLRSAGAQVIQDLIFDINSVKALDLSDNGEDY